MAEETVETVTSKKWYKSRTIWAAIAGIAVILAQVFGISEDVVAQLTGAVEDSVVSGNVEIGSLLTAGAAFVVAIWGRFKAKQPIGNESTDETSE